MNSLEPGLLVVIGAALDAAHEKGVIHRDLKLTNIKVTPDLKVKVLDLWIGKSSAAFGAKRTFERPRSEFSDELATKKGVC